MILARVALAGLFAIALHLPLLSAQTTARTRTDSTFAEWAHPTTPGCAVAAESAGTRVVTRGYGMADLERGVPVTPETIFEAGSASKQFTAAAVLLLADEGRLQLSDDVRRYVPELPDYGPVITIDHLLTHTSGLRDWGIVMWLAGWPRESRVYTNATALDVIVRQRELNQTPGTYFSYSNSGYTLLAHIVERITGRTLAQFTQERMFEPLGMTNTRWRDDFRAVVPGRAIAYARAGTEFVQSMPFEDTYGHAGLLTTVADLLTWNRALRDRRLGGYVTTEMERPGVLADGKAAPYARGLWVSEYRGTHELHHGGGTAGYRGWLGRYPEADLSVALLCNGPANDVALGHAVADEFLPAPAPEAAQDTEDDPVAPLGPGEATALAGIFASEQTGTTLTVTADGDRLKISGRPARLIAPDHFRISWGDFRFEGADRLHLHEQTGEWFESYRRISGAVPSAAELASLEGIYRSAETLASYVASVEDGVLVLRVEDRSGYQFRFRPVGPDAFTSRGDVLLVKRDAEGRPEALTISTVRARGVRLQRD